MIDGDTVFEPDTVAPPGRSRSRTRRSVRSPGNAKVANRRGLIGRWQHIEYVIGFNVDRRVYDVLALHADRCPGAVGAFRRDGAARASAGSATTRWPRTPT